MGHPCWQLRLDTPQKRGKRPQGPRFCLQFCLPLGRIAVTLCPGHCSILLCCPSCWSPAYLCLLPKGRLSNSLLGHCTSLRAVALLRPPSFPQGTVASVWRLRAEGGCSWCVVGEAGDADQHPTEPGTVPHGETG